MIRTLWMASLVLTLAACGETANETDAGTGADSGSQDSGVTVDAGTDGGTDAGTDAGNQQDAGADAGPTVNDTCQNALVLIPGAAPLTGQDTRDGVSDYQFGAGTPSACSDLDSLSYGGKDLAYVVAVPNGKTVTVTVTPSFIPTTWDPALALVTDCALVQTTCLAGSDVINSLAKPEIATWTNTTGAEVQVFAIVDSYTASDPGGHFTIEASL